MRERKSAVCRGKGGGDSKEGKGDEKTKSGRSGREKGESEQRWGGRGKDGERRRREKAGGD